MLVAIKTQKMPFTFCFSEWHFHFVKFFTFVGKNTENIQRNFIKLIYSERISRRLKTLRHAA